MDRNQSILSWFEIPVKDFDRAKKFYETLSGHQMTDMPAGPDHKMATFDPDHKLGISGGIMHGEGYEPSPSGVIIYFKLEGTLSNGVAVAEEAGAKILVPKMTVGEYGFIAHLMDTEGNRIALHSEEE